MSKNYIEEIEEIDDKEFDDLQAEKRNKALIKEIKKLGDIIASNSDTSLMEAISQQQEKIVLLIKSLQNVEKSEISQENFISLTEKIRDEIVESNNKVIDAIQNRQLPDSFELVKNQFGVTQSVTVKYKPAQQIKNI